MLGFPTCTNGGLAISQAACEDTGDTWYPAVAIANQPALCKTGSAFTAATCLDGVTGVTVPTCAAIDSANQTQAVACYWVQGADLDNSTACGAVDAGQSCTYTPWNADATSQAACEDGDKSSEAACEQTGNVYGCVSI